MAVSQSEVNQAVVATASKVAENLVVYGYGTDAPTTAPTTSTSGVDVGTARYVNLLTKVINDTKATLVQVWLLEPKASAGGSGVDVQWTLAYSFWSTPVPAKHRFYVGTSSRLAIVAPESLRVPATAGPENLILEVLRELPASPV